MLPNKKSNQELELFCVSVDEVERITGIGFPPELHDYGSSF